MSGTVRRRALPVALGVQAVSLVACFLVGAESLPIACLTVITIVVLARGLFYQPTPISLEKVVEEKVAERTVALVEQMSVFEQQASTDALTGLLNRRGAEAAISHHIARSRRLGSPISFLLLDIDHFKSVNDRYGHATGDVVISTVAASIRGNLRAADFAARWGGEEYLVCLPDTDLIGAILVGEKLRKGVERIDFDPTPSVSVSVGCAELGDDDFKVVLARADMSLYLAKSAGRNRVVPEIEQNMLDRTRGVV